MTHGPRLTVGEISRRDENRVSPARRPNFCKFSYISCDYEWNQGTAGKLDRGPPQNVAVRFALVLGLRLCRRRTDRAGADRSQVRCAASTDRVKILGPATCGDAYFWTRAATAFANARHPNSAVAVVHRVGAADGCRCLAVAAPPSAHGGRCWRNGRDFVTHYRVQPTWRGFLNSPFSSLSSGFRPW